MLNEMRPFTDTFAMEVLFHMDLRDNDLQYDQAWTRTLQLPEPMPPLRAVCQGMSPGASARCAHGPFRAGLGGPVPEFVGELPRGLQLG